MAAAKKRGMAKEFLYLNYASKEQDVIRGYGEENVKLLRRASKEYDRAGVFQQAVVGGFKLF